MSSKQKILVIDDSEIVLQMTREALEGGGYQVVCLSSPALFPTLLRKEKPNLVLVDVAMPVIGGLSVVGLARRTQMDTCPLVLFSDRPESELRRLAAECKADGFICKTDDPQALCRAVAAFLGGPPTEVLPNEVALMVSQPAVRLILEGYLRQAGCTPISLGADNFLEELARRRPLALLLDLELAPNGGDARCQRIKEHRQARQTPVVVLTANATAQQMMRCWRAGADDCLPLPTTLELLSAKVAALRAARREASAAPGSPQRAVLLCVRHHEEQLVALLAGNGYRAVVAHSRLLALETLKRTGEEVVAAVVELACAGSDPAGLARALAGKQARPVMFVADGPQDPANPALAALPGGPPLDLQRPLELLMNRLNRLLTQSVRGAGLERVPFFSLVDFRKPGDSVWHTGFSYDLSLVGIFVRTLAPLPQGAELELVVEFNGRKHQVQGTVAWSNPFGQRATFAYPPGMGVHLSGLTPELARHVVHLVQGPAATSPLAKEGP